MSKWVVDAHSSVVGRSHRNLVTSAPVVFSCVEEMYMLTVGRFYRNHVTSDSRD